MKKILKTIVLCALAIFASCSEDIYDSHINENHTTKKNKISFENFKQETGLKDFKTSIKINSNTNIETSKNADGSYNLDDFIIDTDLIKKLTVDDKVTYTFRIQPKIITTKNIFNLTVFKIGDFWKMSILELIPTEQNLINLEAGITDKFEGDVKQIYDNSQTIDNPIGAKVVIFYHCTHTGSCINGTCDLCLGWCLTVVTFDEPRSFGTPTGGATESGQNNNDTNNTGGGGNNPGDVLAGSPTYADPSGYTFDPNLPPVGDDFNKAKRATEFWDSLTDGIGSQKEWANLNPDEYNAILDNYLNNYSPEGKDFANEMLNFEMEEDWKTELQLAIASGITSTAELTHKMYGKLSVIATNHPSSIYFINTIIDGFRAVAEPLIDTNPSTCDWTDLFTMWLFELGSNPIDFNGSTVTVLSLQNQEGVAQARAKAIAQIANNNVAPVNNPWIYGQGAFYQGMANGNIATSFLGSYNTTVTITTLPNGQHQLTFHVTNSSTWDSATRLRIDNDHDGAHDGIFPNHVRNATNTLHIGGDFNQDWTWTETY